MHIGVIGAGYVGLVAAACLADKGHQVTCMDVDRSRVSQLNQGCIPIYEPDLEDIVLRQLKAGTLSFTENMASAVGTSQIVFITVGTPSRPDGSVDLSDVLAAADDIGRAMEGYLVIVVKSTVPIGTAELVRERVAQYAPGNFAVLSNPEFLREGQAVHDFLNPDRVIIGGGDDEAIRVLRELYEPFAPSDKVLTMDSRSAEMAKYVSNAFLATRISFINEVANLCEELWVDIEQVRRGVGMDPRIGRAYFAPGLGYGGSCLPKDLRAILTMGQQCNVPLDLLGAVHRVNNNQPTCLSQKIQNHFNGAVLGRRISIWGLAYKSGIDDLRESPAIPLIHSLVKAGAQVTAYDPKANGVARALLGEEVILSDDQYGSLQGAEALVVATDWDEFREADLALVRSLMANPLVFDGGNVYCSEIMREHGFIYFGVGRPSAPVESPILMIDTQG